MKKHQFGSRSLEKLNTCHPDLIKIAQLAITRSQVDFGISEGHRTTERQQQLYAQGRTATGSIVTRVDGIKKKSKHQTKPSIALDFYAYTDQKEFKRKIAFDLTHLAYIAGIMQSCAVELYEKGEISHLLKSGGNWDLDGILKFDQGLIDFPHVELYKP